MFLRQKRILRDEVDIVQYLLGHGTCPSNTANSSLSVVSQPADELSTEDRTRAICADQFGRGMNINDVLPGLDAIYTDLHPRPELEARSARPGSSITQKPLLSTSV
jgi:hypothetical protein